LYQCTADEVAYIGDDIFDIGLLGAVRYADCVADAPLMVKEFADVLACKGGENVIM
jgi:3-deoxy-D-manno-octulosonate 8-phosphate phosphatase KdsC-like HAD superfamily phosphatase